MENCIPIKRAYNNVFRMFKDRKYDVATANSGTQPQQPQPQAVADSFFENPSSTISGLNCTVYKKDKKIQTYWIDELTSESTRNIIAFALENKQPFTLIIIVVGKREGEGKFEFKVTSQSYNLLKDLVKMQYTVQVFSINELLYIPIDHELVPQHIICGKETKEKVLSAYSSSKTSGIPKIHKDDPSCKWLGATSGQLIKILRPNVYGQFFPQHKFYDITYRLVVDTVSKDKKTL